MTQSIRQPAVVGQFYPGEAVQLKIEIAKYLKTILEKRRSVSLGDTERLSGREKRLRALIVPHAGYVFSGPVAAYAYKQIEGRRFQRVILISNSHTSYFNGVAADGHDVWRMPLGDIEVDKDFIKKLVKEEAVKINSEPHLSDHNLEVQLPFLQVVLTEKSRTFLWGIEPRRNDYSEPIYPRNRAAGYSGKVRDKFKIVPLEIGNSGGNSYKKLADVLAQNIGENDLIIISSDLSHYPSYKDANKIDKEMLNKIAGGDIKKLENHIKRTEEKNISNEQTLVCGIDAIKTVMELSNILGWQAEVLKYANSGDSPYGDKESVVGYGAVAYAKI